MNIILIIIGVLIHPNTVCSEPERIELRPPIVHEIAPNPTGSQMIGAPEPMEMQAIYPAE